MNKSIILVAVLVFFGLSGGAMALPVDDGCLDDYFYDKGWDIDIGDYHDVNLPGYELTDGSGASNMIFYHEYPGQYEFGIYSLAGGEEVTVFNAANTPLSATLVSFLGGMTTMNYYDEGGNYTGTNSYAFTGETFGMFATVGTTKIYSDASKNGGAIGMLAYDVAPGAVVFAAELGGLYNDDFCDLVVHAESIQPVPEPATMFLFGSGLCGLVTVIRRGTKRA